MTVAADVTVRNREGAIVGTLAPAQHIYRSNQDQGSEIAIISGPRRDIWMNLAGIKDGVATFQVFVNPMVSWIWAGGLIFLLGAGVADGIAVSPGSH